TCGSVPAELATHLGLEGGMGVLVIGVEPDSPAGRAGLERFDVILAVGEEEARATTLATALEAGAGLALRVVRGGVERNVAVTGKEGANTFLSTSALGPDHPFRRVNQLIALRERYSHEAQSYAARIQEIDRRSREARQESKQAMAALQEACDAQVAEVLAQREQALLAIVDEHLTEERVSRLGALRVELGEALPEDRLEALEERLSELAHELRTAPAEHVLLSGAGDGQNAVDRSRQRFQRVGESAAEILGERLARPWSEALREIAQHTDRLGGKHDQRVEWTLTTVESIREQLYERITCATRRSREELAKQLQRRLRSMEVPAPGELEACLADLHQQLEQMTRRFVTRTVAALDLYEEQLLVRRAGLAPSLAAHLATSM
ncbi:MAG: PDZ domain-containing protein, partial [Longimicrobiales bacterium]